MRNYWRLLALVVTITFSPVTQAQETTNTIIWENSSSWMKLNKGVEFRVKTFDSVKDGCWITRAGVPVVAAISHLVW